MAIKPIYTEVNPQTGDLLAGLHPSDLEKIRQGYGCPNCLEDFTDHPGGGIAAFSRCPVCKQQASPLLVETPQYWLPDPTEFD